MTMHVISYSTSHTKSHLSKLRGSTTDLVPVQMLPPVRGIFLPSPHVILRSEVRVFVEVEHG